MKKIIIIGAGLSGSLLAVKLVRRGYSVDVFEKRPDMRKEDISAGRSINLALSIRGINALKSVGAAEKVLSTAVPMYGRMIHSIGQTNRLSRYSGREGEHLNSVSRGDLNKILMDQAEAEGVNIYFNSPCTRVDFESGDVFITDSKGSAEKCHNADLIFGTDGAGSAVRASMMPLSGRLRFSFSQKYLDHGYKELHIPPGPNGSFKIEKNALHIWPKGRYMLIALPNFDGSFTVTLFMPFGGEPGFDQLTTPEAVTAFFSQQFPDALEQMPTLTQDFFTNPTGSLATVKCYPWQVNGKSLLIGDAAHAVVPFYGQGMNCSFEDCQVLETFMDKYKEDWEKVFTAYQAERKKDADAIGDLAEENYYEMRDHVANPDFIKKRELEMQLEQQYPNYYSKYSMVTFRPDLPYSVAMVKGRKQDELLLDYCKNLASTDQIDLEDVLKKCSQL
ncbi:MAG: FAD-dependent monooxygenase [bacterium]|nr:FAD-dependent monooxygenase [bacterium]